MRNPTQAYTGVETNASRSGICLFLTLALLLLGASPFAAHAQMQQPPPPMPADAAASEATVEMLTSHDLSHMSSDWWNDLEEHIDETLGTSGADVEQAMAKVIFLATFYPDKVDFDDSIGELYNIYRFNDHESYRIMALAALYSIGDENAMRLLAYRGPFPNYAPWESSDLVRRLTAAAIASYYKEGVIEIGPPVPDAVQNEQ